MEPSVRPYNSNSSGQPRRRASKGSKRSDAPVRTPTRKARSGSSARKAVVETLPDVATPIGEAAPEQTNLTNIVEDIEDHAASPETAEAGPVVTITDLED
ncbi:MAG TPA: hypothetical protein VFU63_02410, partial [Ktedonobacterales bacterium]|nr:hypothetical protein [Ktedonobacterales bacterium]